MALAEMQAAVTVVKQTVECPSSADFFQNPGQKVLTLCHKGSSILVILDEKAPETVPFALGGGRTFAADFFVYGKREENGLYFLIFGKMQKRIWFKPVRSGCENWS